MFIFNVNHYVYVKLTETGKAELRKQHEMLRADFPKMMEFTPTLEDDEGWSKWQLHHLMNTFGHLMMLGNETPFENDMRFEVIEP